ncbi:uncharacterized protein LACBIDRAFT_334619 [Laccaria bicolor S238N-H82]|uniref:Predicted protein n=1 Tax=Laccaria bicolor (strain S238N-H82 / ATCC MYA-4686) TaxID=486041 RepID=B0DZR3_LACBS|nr:uncharacterized protein LACBIDRAFT_334619 [Laccaria bicolor S238N-H82]EDQ99878.1 predicted protein [Laccaria bicolor S238N-H82]|eukprot:XP_001889421.1 predicted protein [Laccaria bicolor S238N-H82]
MSLPLPLELICEIIDFLLSSAPPRFNAKHLGWSTKHSWHALNAFSLTSRTYRALVLEAWFRTLYVESPKDLEYVRCCWPEVGARWTRHLHCAQAYSSSLSLWDLSYLPHISSIRLDWLPPFFMQPFHSRPSSKSGLPLFNCSSSVEHLDLRGFLWPILEVLQNISHTPGLAYLKTFTIEREMTWCGFCGSFSSVQFKDMPTAVYERGYGLPIDYARALAPLEYLEKVVITVIHYPLGSTTTPTIPDPDPETNPNTNQWMGECDKCVKTKNENDAFRQKSVDRKWGVDVCRDDDDGKDTRPPKLRSKKTHQEPKTITHIHITGQGIRAYDEIRSFLKTFRSTTLIRTFYQSPFTIGSLLAHTHQHAQGSRGIGARLTWGLNGPEAALSPYLVRLALPHTQVMFPLPLKVLGTPTPPEFRPTLTFHAARPECPYGGLNLWIFRLSLTFRTLGVAFEDVVNEITSGVVPTGAVRGVNYLSSHHGYHQSSPDSDDLAGERFLQMAFWSIAQHALATSVCSSVYTPSRSATIPSPVTFGRLELIRAY